MVKRTTATLATGRRGGQSNSQATVAGLPGGLQKQPVGHSLSQREASSRTRALPCATGVIYWSCIPDIERRGERLSLVTFILVCGAASRLMTVVGHGVANIGILLSLIAGLVLVPLLWLWQRHIAQSAQRGAVT